MPLLPTFSPSGWVSSPIEKADFLLAHFFSTQPSQTHFHRDQINSYQVIIADAESPSDLATTLETYLGEYLGTQFTNVALGVTVDVLPEHADKEELTITIGCSFDADGKRFSLDRAIVMLGTQYKRIDRINRTGALNE